MASKILAGVAAVVLVLLAGGARAAEADEATLEILGSTIQANRKALIAVNLGLSDEESGVFWPIYDRYERELAEIRRRLAAVIDEYAQNFAQLTDAQAHDLVQRYLAVESDRSALRQSYLQEFSGVLPGKKVMRFYQMENKMDAVIRYQIAATIPVVEP